MDSTTHDHSQMTTTTHNHGAMTTTPHDHGTSSGGGHRMIMHGGILEVVVFAEWTTKDIGGFIGTCFALFFIAFAYEGVKFCRDQITRSLAILKKNRQIKDRSDDKQLEIEERRYNNQTYFEKMVSAEHLIQLVLHVIQFFISYFLMLAVMTYNSWLCMSILIGIGVGFLFFGVRRTKINLEEDCH